MSTIRRLTVLLQCNCGCGCGCNSCGGSGYYVPAFSVRTYGTGTTGPTGPTGATEQVL